MKLCRLEKDLVVEKRIFKGMRDDVREDKYDVFIYFRFGWGFERKIRFFNYFYWY